MPTIRLRPDGSLSIRLPHPEGLILWTLPQRLRDLLDNDEFNKRVVDRLFPRAYREDDEEEEYRKLLGDDLKDRKLASMEIYERSLERAKFRSWGLELTVRAEEVEAWMGFVNDIRLFLGTELDIRDNDWGDELDLEEPQSDDIVLLHFLTWLQQEVLDSLGFSNPASPAEAEPLSDVIPDSLPESISDSIPEEDDDGPIV